MNVDEMHIYNLIKLAKDRQIEEENIANANYEQELERRKAILDRDLGSTWAELKAYIESITVFKLNGQKTGKIDSMAFKIDASALGLTPFEIVVHGDGQIFFAGKPYLNEDTLAEQLLDLQLRFPKWQAEQKAIAAKPYIEWLKYPLAIANFNRENANEAFSYLASIDPDNIEKWKILLDQALEKIELRERGESERIKAEKINAELIEKYRQALIAYKAEYDRIYKSNVDLFEKAQKKVKKFNAFILEYAANPSDADYSDIHTIGRVMVLERYHDSWGFWKVIHGGCIKRINYHNTIFLEDAVTIDPKEGPYRDLVIEPVGTRYVFDVHWLYFGPNDNIDDLMPEIEAFPERPSRPEGIYSSEADKVEMEVMGEYY